MTPLFHGRPGLRSLLVACLLMSAVMAAVSVEFTPKFVRLPFNQSKTFEVRLVGEGRLYDLKAYGTGLSWSQKSVWVGSYGKTETLTFTPPHTGDFVITVEMGNTSCSAEVTVYLPQATDLASRISEARGRVQTDADRAQLDEVERLFNESRYTQAEIKLNELLAGLQSSGQARSHSTLPYFLLAVILLVAVIIVAKLVF